MPQLTSLIHLDFRSGLPIYVQIVEQVQGLVADGSLKPGDQLPTVRQLATDLRINFNTVSRAYRILDDARLISTQRGRGTYIWETPTEETMKMMKNQSLEALARTFLKEAQRLGYTSQEAQIELNRIILQLDSGGTQIDIIKT
jgi:GntR family transcriptional regulator